jgi:hypothetical protein
MRVINVGSGVRQEAIKDKDSKVKTDRNFSLLLRIFFWRRETERLIIFRQIFNVKSWISCAAK